MFAWHLLYPFNIDTEKKCGKFTSTQSDSCLAGKCGRSCFFCWRTSCAWKETVFCPTWFSRTCLGRKRKKQRGSRRKRRGTGRKSEISTVNIIELNIVVNYFGKSKVCNYVKYTFRAVKDWWAGFGFKKATAERPFLHSPLSIQVFKCNFWNITGVKKSIFTVWIQHQLSC